MLGKLFSKKSNTKNKLKNTDSNTSTSSNNSQTQSRGNIKKLRKAHSSQVPAHDDVKANHADRAGSPKRTQDDLDYTSAQMAQKQAKVNNRAQKRHSHIAGSLKSHQSTEKKLKTPEDRKSRSKQTAVAGSQLMASSQTNARLQQLMGMRTGKDSKYRARSVNYKKAKQRQNENKFPKKRRNEVHKADGEPRRHSMHPSPNDVAHEKHLKDRRNTQTKKKLRKVQYRVKNEVFVLYDHYQPVRIIGSGAYAVVCEALNTKTGKQVAIKKNKGVFDHITDARRILREIKLMMHFHHQDIIKLLDVIPCESHEIDTYNDCYIVMPKMETTLAKVIRSKQKLTDRHYQFFIYQMLRGLRYMHSANVIHRDLKPENILINGADCNVKITDFGLARGVCKDDNIEKPTEYVVTRWYRSPEVMCSAGFYDEKVDIWSLGCIFAELILRRPVFPGQNYLDQLKIIFEIMGTPKDLTWIKTPEAKRWVMKLQAHNGKPFPVVFENASEKALTLLKRMLVMDPARRADAEECIRNVFFKELYREEDEEECPPFDLSFEFEKSIKTKFGVRHMMYDALISWDKKRETTKLQHQSRKKISKGMSNGHSAQNGHNSNSNSRNNGNTKSSSGKPKPQSITEEK